MFRPLIIGVTLAESDAAGLGLNICGTRSFFYLLVSSGIMQIAIQLSHLIINKLSYVTFENHNIHTCLVHALRVGPLSLFFRIARVLRTLNSK